MRYNSHLGQFFNNFINKKDNLNESTKTFFARVSYVVHDENSLFYKENGKVKAINGIKYRPLHSAAVENSLENLPFAYCGNSNIVSVPLIDEIVKITEEPSEYIGDEQSSAIRYYTRIVNIWNNPLHNALPSLTEDSEARLGLNLPEPIGIRNLQSFPGDTYIEGRLGQSLRFSGFNSQVNPFTDESNNSKPFTILRNGQKVENDIEKTVIEDINLDDSSLYLTSDHTIPINLSIQNYNSFLTPEEKPIEGNKYRGRQIIIDSGRVLINAKDDHILLSSLKGTSISSNTVNLDANSYIAIEGPEIYLGSKSFNKQEPAIKGGQNNSWLLSLINTLDNIAQTLSVIPPSSTGMATLLNEAGISLTAELSELKRKLPDLISKKIYIE